MDSGSRAQGNSFKILKFLYRQLDFLQCFENLFKFFEESIINQIVIS